MTRKSWLLGWIAAISLAGFLAAADRPAAARIYDPAREPARDLDAAISEATQDGKRILLEVGGNWCGWCRELDSFLRRDAKVTEALHCAFVVVKVNVSPENSNTRFLARFPEVPGYPYFFVLDASGSLLAAVDTDDFVSGESYDHARLMTFARRWTAAESRGNRPAAGARPGGAR
jgi:thiol:disulfide interchange protein